MLRNKELQFFGFLALLLFATCKESLPPVNFETDNLQTLKDTSYLLPENEWPEAQQKQVFIEDLTGVRCPNCPDAAKTAHKIDSTYPGRIIIAGLYTESPTNLTFPHSGDEDLRISEATLLYTNIYGSPPLPGGGVNRIVAQGQSTVNQQYSLWNSTTAEELSKKALVNLDINIQTYSDSSLKLGLDIVFTELVEEMVFVSIMLLEDGIEAVQTGSQGEIHDYIHQHVLRKMYTAYNGNILVTNAEKGRAIERELEISIPDRVKVDKASIVVFLSLNEPDNKTVLQCQKVKLN